MDNNSTRIDFDSRAKAEGFAADLHRMGERAEVTESDGTWWVDCDPEDTSRVDAGEKAIS